MWKKTDQDRLHVMTTSSRIFRVRNLFLCPWTVGLNDLMKISLVLAIFSLARQHFHWPRIPGQLLRSQTGICSLSVGYNKEVFRLFFPRSAICPSGRIGPQYLRLIIKSDKRGQRSEKLNLEAVWKAVRTINYHNEQTNKQTHWGSIVGATW